MYSMCYYSTWILPFVDLCEYIRRYTYNLMLIIKLNWTVDECKTWLVFGWCVYENGKGDGFNNQTWVKRMKLIFFSFIFALISIWFPLLFMFLFVRRMLRKSWKHAFNITNANKRMKLYTKGCLHLLPQFT